MKSRAVSATNKRGRTAKFPKPVKKTWKSPKGAWIGKVKIAGDIVEFDSAHRWDALR
jgi:hypothetical protein